MVPLPGDRLRDGSGDNGEGSVLCCEGEYDLCGKDCHGGPLHPNFHLDFHFAFVFTLKLIAILTQPRLYSR